jgi:DNA-binding MarR family transcriptional regulator
VSRRPTHRSSRAARASRAATDPDVAAVERAMVRIRRSIARRTFGRVLNERLGETLDWASLGVVESVAEGPGPDGEPVSVGLVAERLAIDPSRASRMVAAAVDAGLVARVATASDARRIGLELTDDGRALERTVRAHRATWLAAAMQDWSAADRRRFAELFTRFVDALVPDAASDGGEADA